MVRRRYVSFARSAVLLLVSAAVAAVLLPAGAQARQQAAAAVECGDVITADTTLTSDLFCPGSDGIVIGAGGVTLDLGGHTISGSGFGNGVSNPGGFGADLSDVTIENGVITRFGTGVFVGDFVFGITIRDLTVTRNAGDGIYLNLQDRNAQIISNEITRNGRHGIGTGDGIDGALYQDNRVSRNALDGIFTNVSISSFIGNVVTRNGRNGIHSVDIADLFVCAYTYKDNVADRNGSFGMLFELFHAEHTSCNVNDQGGNEAKLNGGPAQCQVWGLVCLSRPDETRLTYTGSTTAEYGGSARLSARLVDVTDQDTPLAGMTIAFRLGSQSCTGTSDAAGLATCTVQPVQAALGPQTLDASFTGNTYNLPSADTSNQAIVFAFPARAAFVLGDQTVASASSSTVVTWWADNWATLNSLSGGPAPALFFGFANTMSTTGPTCGGRWVSRLTATDPSARVVPAYMGVIVSSNITRSGTAFSGDVADVVVVKTNPGYSPRPGAPGTGTIVATHC